MKSVSVKVIIAIALLAVIAWQISWIVKNLKSQEGVQGAPPPPVAQTQPAAVETQAVAPQGQNPAAPPSPAQPGAPAANAPKPGQPAGKAPGPNSASNAAPSPQQPLTSIPQVMAAIPNFEAGLKLSKNQAQLLLPLAQELTANNATSRKLAFISAGVFNPEQGKYIMANFQNLTKDLTPPSNTKSQNPLLDATLAALKKSAKVAAIPPLPDLDKSVNYKKVNSSVPRPMNGSDLYAAILKLNSQPTLALTQAQALKLLPLVNKLGELESTEKTDSAKIAKILNKNQIAYLTQSTDKLNKIVNEFPPATMDKPEMPYVKAVEFLTKTAK